MINRGLFLLHTVHGFLQAEYDVDEDERLDTVFQLNVKGTTQFGSNLCCPLELLQLQQTEQQVNQRSTNNIKLEGPSYTSP